MATNKEMIVAATAVLTSEIDARTRELSIKINDLEHLKVSHYFNYYLLTRLHILTRFLVIYYI